MTPIIAEIPLTHEMPLSQAITLALADEFGCLPERIAQWLAEHGYTLPSYLRRHGLGEYAEAVDVA